MTTKVGSAKLEAAEIKLNAVKGIDSEMEFSPGVTVATYAEAVEVTRQRLDAYNEALAVLERERLALREAEKGLQAITVKVLPAIALKHGKESSQYSMVGGVRPSEQKRTPRKLRAEKQSAA
jgi:hypothetical protein